jgi:hypothetical protein
MGMAEHDPLEPAHSLRDLPERLGHGLDAGVEHRHPVVLLDEVDVHGPPREPAADGL